MAGTKGAADAKKTSRQLLRVDDEAVPSCLLLQQRPPAAPPQIGPVQSSELFSKLQSFLPQLAAANIELEQRIASGEATAVDIEVVEDETAPHVEMDVSLGVLDLKTQEAVAAAENATGGEYAEPGGGDKGRQSGGDQKKGRGNNKRPKIIEELSKK